VRRRVHRPGVPWLQLERAAGGVLRLAVLVALFEAKRVHAEEVGVAGHARAPARQHAGDPVSEVERVAPEKIDQVRGLDRQPVVRVIDEHAIEERAGAPPVAVDQRAGRGDQGALVRVGARN